MTHAGPDLEPAITIRLGLLEGLYALALSATVECDPNDRDEALIEEARCEIESLREFMKKHPETVSSLVRKGL